LFGFQQQQQMQQQAQQQQQQQQAPPLTAEDSDAAALALRRELDARVTAAAGGSLPNALALFPALRPLLEAVNAYLALSRFLSGELPSPRLLPPCPRGYVAQRLRSLAEDGTGCVGSMAWNGGGPWKGRAWAAHGGELPTDSALLFHAVAGFVAWPRWEVGADWSPSDSAGGSGVAGGAHLHLQQQQQQQPFGYLSPQPALSPSPSPYGGSPFLPAHLSAPPGSSPFFAGVLPTSRAPESYHALLSLRPPGGAPRREGAAVVGLGLGTSSPAFLLLASAPEESSAAAADAADAAGAGAAAERRAEAAAARPSSPSPSPPAGQQQRGRQQQQQRAPTVAGTAAAARAPPALPPVAVTLGGGTGLLTALVLFFSHAAGSCGGLVGGRPLLRLGVAGALRGEQGGGGGGGMGGGGGGGGTGGWGSGSMGGIGLFPANADFNPLGGLAAAGANWLGSLWWG
jgi:hypothetical protein